MIRDELKESQCIHLRYGRCRPAGWNSYRPFGFAVEVLIEVDKCTALIDSGLYIEGLSIE